MLLCEKVCNFTKNDEKMSNFKLNSTKKSLINLLAKEWISIMANLGLYNKMMNTYSLNNIEVTTYGFKSDIFVVHGLNFKTLEEKRDTIQENLGCMILFNANKTSSFISAKFIFNQNDTLGFKPIQEKNPYVLYVGNDYSGQPIFISLKDYPHGLITGGTRSGKSKMTDVILTNLIINCSPNELMLYLIQVAKSDLILYEDAIQTRAFADTLQKAVVALRHIVDRVMVERDNLIKPYRKKALADNCHDYNNLKSTEKIPICLVVFDEMSSLYQTQGDTKEAKKLKEEVKFLTDRIAQYGASLGVFLLCSLQRPSHENLSPFVKSQATALISFRQNNAKSAEVATDDASLPLGLKQREFVFKTNNWNYGIVPWVNNQEIYNYIKSFLKPGHRDLFQDLEKECKRDGAKINYKEKISQDNSFSKVGSYIKTEKEILDENISKIKDFVPYTPPSSNIVIEKKTNQTNKPIKQGKEKLNDN